jgi:hypothetical protein
MIITPSTQIYIDPNQIQICSNEVELIDGKTFPLSKEGLKNALALISYFAHNNMCTNIQVFNTQHPDLYLGGISVLDFTLLVEGAELPTRENQDNNNN